MEFWHILAYGAAACLVLRGVLRGFSGTVGGLAGLAAGVGVWVSGAEPLGRAVAEAGWFDGSPLAGRIAAFVLVLTACLAAWLLLGHVLKATLKMAVRQPFDAILGGGVGAAEAWLVIFVIKHALEP